MPTIAKSDVYCQFRDWFKINLRRPPARCTSEARAWGFLPIPTHSEELILAQLILTGSSGQELLVVSNRKTDLSSGDDPVCRDCSKTSTEKHLLQRVSKKYPNTHRKTECTRVLLIGAHHGPYPVGRTRLGSSEIQPPLWIAQ